MEVPYMARVYVHLLTSREQNITSNFMLSGLHLCPTFFSFKNKQLLVVMGQACKIQALTSLGQAWGLIHPYRWVVPAKPKPRQLF